MERPWSTISAPRRGSAAYGLVEAKARLRTVLVRSWKSESSQCTGSDDRQEAREFGELAACKLASAMDSDSPRGGRLTGERGATGAHGRSVLVRRARLAPGEGALFVPLAIGLRAWQELVRTQYFVVSAADPDDLTCGAVQPEDVGCARSDGTSCGLLSSATCRAPWALVRCASRHQLSASGPPRA